MAEKILREYVGRDHVPPTKLRLYGIEVEYENYRGTAHRPSPEWQIKDDGSLRNGGIEYVFRRPLAINSSHTAIDSLWEMASSLRLKPSPRTGIHVHVNCLDYSLSQILDILTNYVLMEPFLFAYVGPLRDESILCVPW